MLKGVIDIVTTLLEYMVAFYCKSSIFAPLNSKCVKFYLHSWCKLYYDQSFYKLFVIPQHYMRGENVCLWTFKWYKHQRRRLYLLNTLHTLQLQGLSVMLPCRFPTIQPADSCLDCTRYRGGREVAALAWVGAALFHVRVFTVIYFVFKLWHWRFLPSRADSDLGVARLTPNVCVVRIQRLDALL